MEGEEFVERLLTAPRRRDCILVAASACRRSSSRSRSCSRSCSRACSCSRSRCSRSRSRALARADLAAFPRALDREPSEVCVGTAASCGTGFDFAGLLRGLSLAVTDGAGAEGALGRWSESNPRNGLEFTGLERTSSRSTSPFLVSWLTQPCAQRIRVLPPSRPRSTFVSSTCAHARTQHGERRAWVLRGECEGRSLGMSRAYSCVVHIAREGMGAVRRRPIATP